MKLKRINAILGLMSILFICIHIGYNVFAYLTFYYNPFLSKLFSTPILIIICLHAVCGMITVSIQKDGGRMDLYPKQNLGTILQRISAALIFPLLILHMNTFSLMEQAAEKARFFVIILVFAELLFFAVVITHVVISFTKGLITLGFLTDVRRMKAIDKIAYIVGMIVFILSAYAVIRAQITMFLG